MIDDNERAVIQQVRNDLKDALNKSPNTKLTMYAESRIRAAITQLDYLLNSKA